LLALLAGWLLIVTVALPPGSWLLARVDRQQTIRRAGDRAMLSLWLGLLLLCLALTALSLLAPLRPGYGALLAAAMAGAGCSSRVVRAELLGACAALRSNAGWSLALAVGAVAVAMRSIAPVTAYDAGLYHQQYVQWLASTGLPPGLALIHGRFGFPGTWFALPAIFGHGALQARTLPLGGGLVLLLLFAQLLLAARRWLQGHAQPADRYAVYAFGLMLVYVADKGWFSAASPDAPVFVLSALVAWALLLAPAASTLLPAILALGALSLKLSAAPLLLLTLLPLRWAQRAHLVIPAAIVAAVLLGQSFISTGCLVYPLPQSCLATPWSVGAAAAAREAIAVRDWARWSGAVPAHAAGLAWLPGWASAHDLELVLLAAALLGIAWRRRSLAATSGRSALAVATGAIAVGVLVAPDPRFWAGNIFSLLGLAGILIWPAARLSRRVPQLVAGILLLATALLVAPRMPPATWLLPARLQVPAVTGIGTASGLAYGVPAQGEQCWAAALPCAPARLAESLRYRDAAAGLASGFTSAH
jgi:hypothetical protein